VEAAVVVGQKAGTIIVLVLAAVVVWASA
jgi:hypothetical protein